MQHAASRANAERSECSGRVPEVAFDLVVRDLPTDRAVGACVAADGPEWAGRLGLRAGDGHRFVTRGILCGGPSRRSCSSGTSSMSGTTPIAANTERRDLFAHRVDSLLVPGRVPDSQSEPVDLATGPHDLEQAERARVDLFHRAPHVDRHHRPPVDDDLVALPPDGPHPRVRAPTLAALAREPDDVVGAVANERRDLVRERSGNELAATTVDGSTASV